MPLIPDLFARAMTAFGIRSGDALAVAVSGGADSMALLKAAVDFGKQNGNRVIALTVNHGLRPESAAEARQVADWAHTLGIEAEILVWRGEKPQTGIEQAARNHRYALLFDACRRLKIRNLLLGHHKRDQAETFLMRQARHSGEIGLAGMSAVKSFAFGKMLRPFLGVEPSELRAFARENGLSWVEDPTNATTQFERGRLRQTVSAEVLEDAFRQTVLYGKKRRVLEEKTADFYRRFLTLSPMGYALLPQDAFETENPVLPYALGEILRVVANAPYAPDAAALDALIFRIKNDFRGCTLGGCRIAPCTKNQILIWREERSLPPAVSFDETGFAYWGGFAVSVSGAPFKNLAVGALNRPMKTEIGIPKRIVPTLPAIFENEKLCIVPHLGYKQNQMSCQAVFAPAYPLVQTAEWTPPLTV